jgi:hypothetical protein
MDQAVGLAPAPLRTVPKNYEAEVCKAQVLVMDSGVVLSRSEAANRLGCRDKTLIERLRKYRSGDGTQARVQLRDLAALSEKYRQL